MEIIGKEVWMEIMIIFFIIFWFVELMCLTCSIIYYDM